MASRTRSSNPRAWLAVLFGVAGVLAIPAAVAVARQSKQVGLIDGAWAIPVAIACGVAALLFARGGRAHIHSTLARARGAKRLRLARMLAVLGISVALSATIAIGFYELLLRLEK